MRLAARFRGSPMNKPAAGLALPLAKTALVTLTALVLYQLAKFFLIPDITLWQSYTMTIVFGSSAATIVAYFVISRQRSVDRRWREGMASGTSDAFVAMDRDGRITDWNARAEETFGWTSAEAVGRLLCDTIVPAASRAAHTQGLELFLATGKGPLLNRRVELSALHRDGREFPVELAITAVGSGRTSVFSAFVRDISERRRAEDELRLVNELLSVIGAAPDARSALVVVLQRICGTTGWSLGQAWLPDAAGTALTCAPDWHDGGDPAGRALRTKSEKATFARGVGLPGRAWACGQPVRLRDAADDERYPRTGAGPDETGVGVAVPVLAGQEVVAVLEFLIRTPHPDDNRHAGVASRVAAQLGSAFLRKRAEDTLRESEDLFRQMAETIDDVFWVSETAVGPLRYVSPAFERLFGRPCSPLSSISLRWRQALHADDKERVLRVSEDKDKHGTYDLTYRVLHADGSIRWIRDRAFSVLDSQGEVVRMFGVAQDVTAVAEADEALRVSEDQLRQAQKMEAVGRLAGGIAHDFNNLLTVILGFGQLCTSRTDLDPSLRSKLEQMIGAGERAAQLTHQLLAFSRRQVLSPEALDLNAVTRDAHAILARVIGEDIELCLALDPALGTVLADRGQFGQVLMNLVVNSRDAMPRGGRLTITTRNVEVDAIYAGSEPGLLPGPYAVVCVADTGLGMTAETRSRLFEPFFTTKERGKGTGLGLSTVYGIVKQSRGHISVHSELGRGTTFTIYMPRIGEDVPAAKRPAPEPLPEGGRETVLLVEDEPALRMLAQEILEERGYRVLTAESGSDAVEVASGVQAVIHLLLTDVVMPGMSGKQLAATISELHPESAVLFMSGYSDDVISDHGILEARVDLIEKPYTPDSLLLRVRAALDR